MTSADQRRVRKALQGKDFPAGVPELLAYARDRGSDNATLEAIRSLPEREYHDAADVENSLPQQPFEAEAPSPAADKPQQPAREEQ